MEICVLVNLGLQMTATYFHGIFYYSMKLAKNITSFIQFDVVHHMLNGKSHLGSLMVELLCCCYCSSQRSYSNTANAVKVMESRSAVKIFTTSRRATPIGLTGLQPPCRVCQPGLRQLCGLATV